MSPKQILQIIIGWNKKNHISKLTKAVSQKFDLLFRSTCFFTAGDLHTIHKCQITSTIQYCFHGWGAVRSRLLDGFTKRTILLIDKPQLNDNPSISYRCKVGDFCMCMLSLFQWLLIPRKCESHHVAPWSKFGKTRPK